MTNRNILTFDDFKIYEQEKTKKAELPGDVQYNKNPHNLYRRKFAIRIFDGDKVGGTTVEIEYCDPNEETIILSFYTKEIAPAENENLKSFASAKKTGGSKVGTWVKDLTTQEGAGKLLSSYFWKCGQKSRVDEKFMVPFVKILQWLNQEYDDTLPESFEDFIGAIKENVKDKKGTNSLFAGTTLAKTTQGDLVINRFFELLKA